MVKIAVLGYGTVGSGVVEVIERNRMLIEKRVGKRLEVKYVLDIRDFPGDPYEDRIVHDAERILKDPEVEIICETMGGIEPAYTYSKRALEAGKSVCTSNKELVAAHGAELIALSEKHGCNYLFEASVGGGIPIIRPLNCALTAERVVEITGILNGTTNYILTRMEKDGADFGTVLKEAQQKGYAERNPEADVEGYDACRKIAILTSLIAGRTVDFGEIHTEGITGITPEDFQYARAMGRTIKLLAVSREEEDGYLASVTPCMLKKEVPLALVNGVFNAVSVCGNTLGESMFYGKGAGKLPTASAVVSDVVDCARHLGEHMVCIWEDEPVRLKPFEEGVSRFFVRMKEESEAEADAVFGPVAKIRLRELSGEYGFLTEPMTEREFAGKHRKVSGMISRIRVRD